jgi:benzoyl-CoA reductase/2-hydroxyglutaryl-CoA dehydratase subunit BcrC/BadD/HgdB
LTTPKLYVTILYAALETADKKVTYSHRIPFPHGAQNRATYKYLTGELEKFVKSIEDWTGKTLTDEDLDRGIEIMDTNRRLMATEDAHEGLAAFMEKRAPVWKDR